MQHNRLLVFDIETVPDTAAVANLLDLPEGEAQDEQTLRQALKQYHLDITDGRNDFPRQPFHKVVAISFVEAEIERVGRHERYHLKDIRSGGEVETSEEDLIKGFNSFAGKSFNAMPRLVTYNGRNFDLPVLKFRAMKYKIPAPWFYQSGDKWNSYTSRYSADWHCDLADALRDFGGMQGGLKLNEVCSILGYPGKFGPDGSKVEQMYDDGDVTAIRQYCETDVVNTYLVYLSYQMHCGVLQPADYERAIEDVLSYLQNNAEGNPHFVGFLEAWAAAGDAIK